jgi:hypothetical protein
MKNIRLFVAFFALYACARSVAPDAGVIGDSGHADACAAPAPQPGDAAGRRRIVGNSLPGCIPGRYNFVDDADSGITTSCAHDSTPGSSTYGMDNITIHGGGGVTSVTGAGTVNCSPTTGAVTCTGTNAVSSVTGTSGVSCSPTTGAVSCSNTGVTSVAAGTGISVSGATGGVTITNTVSLPTLTNHALVRGQGTTVPLFLAPGVDGNVATSDGTDWTSTFPTFVESGFTNGSGVGSVSLTAGGAYVAIADTLTMTGVPINAKAIASWSVQIIGSGASGTEVDFHAIVDGSNVVSEAAQFPSTVIGATNPLGGRWTVTFQTGALSAGSHTFDLKATMPSGATGSANAQSGFITVWIVTA